MRKLITVVLLLLITNLQAQDEAFQKLYVTPAVSLGFTFGGLFNLGVDLDLTTSVTNDLDKIRNAGISTSYYFILSIDVRLDLLLYINFLFNFLYFTMDFVVFLLIFHVVVFCFSIVFCY